MWLHHEYFQSRYPAPNDPGRDTNNIAAYRFAAPIENTFNTLLGRIDYNMTALGNHKLFGRFGKQHDTISDPPQFPGHAPAAAAAVEQLRPGARFRLCAVTNRLLTVFATVSRESMKPTGA